MAAVVNAMTVDVEDYFQVSAFDDIVPRDGWASRESRVCANTERLIRIFDDAGIKATFFVLGWVADRFPALVRTIAREQHEVASHGYGHRLIYDQSPSEFREDIRRAKDLLESLAEKRVLGFRAPSYSITSRTLWALDILAEEGYAYDASIFPIRHDRYGIPSAPRHAFLIERGGRPLVEVPASTVRLGRLNVPVAGGGYFRIFPYWWTFRGIARVNRVEGKPAVFYIHPWEIDPDQPRLPADAIGRFRHYRNLDKTEARLRQLVRDFAFAPIDRMVANARPIDASGLASLAGASQAS